MGFLDKYRPVLAIDAGTQSLRVSKDGEMIFNEATAIAIHPEKHKVDHIGNAAIELTGMRLYQPFDYVIQDFQAFELLLKGVTNKIKHRGLLLPTYKMFFSIPMTASSVDMRAFRDAGEHANAIEVYMCRSAVLAALNMGLLNSKKNFFLIEFSTSKLEFTVFTNGTPTNFEGIKLGTKKLEKWVKNHLKRQYGIDVEEEELRQIVNSYTEKTNTLHVQSKEVATSEIHEIIDRYLWIVEDCIKSVIEDLDHHHHARAASNGLYFTGGGSLYQNLCQSLSERIRLPAHFSEQPFLDPILGLEQVAQNTESFKDILMV